VRLASRLGDVAAYAEDDLSVAGPESDLALSDDGVLVLPRVHVRRHAGANGERVFHDGHLSVRLLTEELEDHTDGP
jgi:hypothetical protein